MRNRETTYSIATHSNLANVEFGMKYIFVWYRGLWTSILDFFSLAANWKKITQIFLYSLKMSIWAYKTINPSTNQISEKNANFNMLDM